MPDRKTVMISSTARDLPKHRQAVMDACLRQGMFPLMMEHLPASDADAIEVSLKMVEEADIYLGIYAHRYGYVPEGHDISITEMEYNRAAELGKPRLIFVMHDDHPVRESDLDRGDKATQLDAFKERLLKGQVAGVFKNPADLRALAIDSLSNYGGEGNTETETTDPHTQAARGRPADQAPGFSGQVLALCRSWSPHRHPFHCRVEAKARVHTDCNSNVGSRSRTCSLEAARERAAFDHNDGHRPRPGVPQRARNTCGGYWAVSRRDAPSERHTTGIRERRSNGPERGREKRRGPRDLVRTRGGHPRLSL